MHSHAVIVTEERHIRRSLANVENIFFSTIIFILGLFILALNSLTLSVHVLMGIGAATAMEWPYSLRDSRMSCAC